MESMRKATPDPWSLLVDKEPQNHPTHLQSKVSNA